VGTQRSQYKDLKNGQETAMNEGKVTRLESMGFQWDLSRDAWDKSFAELQTFKAAKGHCNVPGKYEVSVETIRRPLCLTFSHPDRSAVNKSPGESKTGILGDDATQNVPGPQKRPRDGNEQRKDCSVGGLGFSVGPAGTTGLASPQLGDPAKIFYPSEG
jgi:Helicase associated domain